MKQPIRISRSVHPSHTARLALRRHAVSRTVTRIDLPVRSPILVPEFPASLANVSFQPDPYVDYGRFLTAEGGILIVYKDLDIRLRHTLWRLLFWTAATGFEGWYMLHHSPLAGFWINLLCFVGAAIVNWLIVAKPVETYRHLEFRPDCMIVEGGIFWTRLMENGPPTLQPDKEGNQVLCGIYGNRFVEYLTVRRFDELDRTPEIIAAHIEDAIRQLWMRPF